MTVTEFGFGYCDCDGESLAIGVTEFGDCARVWGIVTEFGDSGRSVTEFDPRPFYIKLSVDM